MVTKLIILGLASQKIEVSIQLETQIVSQYKERNSQSSSVTNGPL
jgi:hypothetical protein